MSFDQKIQVIKKPEAAKKSKNLLKNRILKLVDDAGKELGVEKDASHISRD